VIADNLCPDCQAEMRPAAADYQLVDHCLRFLVECENPTCDREYEYTFQLVRVRGIDEEGEPFGPNLFSPPEQPSG
jgi:hypothetical protein